MKRLLVLLGCAVLLFSGCQELSRDKKKTVEVIIEGGGEFPQFLVGTWKADKHGWEFVFEPDGTISSAVVSIGRVRMKPAEVTTFPTKGGGKGVFKPGAWTVAYEPDTRKLEVQIVIDHFYQQMGDNAIEGNSTDIFTGQVSQNGKEWTTEWYSFPEYIAYTPEPHQLPVDPNDNPKDTLVFRKITSANQ